MPALNAQDGDSTLAERVVRWQRAHGRSGLPWQGSRDPYRVWLSEIMLQQTQVATVLGYYERFLARFPDVVALAAASEDEVLGLWSGLGYYSRARNLHRCAQSVAQVHGGRFPGSAEALKTLPGIGRSTAAAIAAFCFDERVAILDGNVKRVISRVLAFEGDLALAAQEKRLWALAQDLVPARGQDMPAYTQGLMDLGATVCLVRSPDCAACPLQAGCSGRRQGQPERFPVRTRQVKRSAQSLWLLLGQRADGAVWLTKRPGTGIWAGLHCLPVFESADGLEAALAAADGPGTATRSALAAREDLPPFVHVLTHKDLHLHPVLALLEEKAQLCLEGAWVSATVWPSLGLPAPVRRLLEARAPDVLP